MLKLILPAAALSLVLASCGGVSAEDNKKGVDVVCSCMAEADAKSAANASEGGLDLGDAMRIVDYSICAIDAAVEGADVQSDDFASQLKENCPDLVSLHTEYLKDIK